MILAHFCVARIRDFGQGSDDCAYIIPHPFAKINTILSKFVHICPSLSNLRSKALHPQANFHRIRKLSVLCSVLFHAAPCDTT